MAPAIATVQIIEKSVHPQTPRNEVSRIGVYVPAISKNIETWSNRANRFLSFGFEKLWYKVEDRYKRIKVQP